MFISGHFHVLGNGHAKTTLSMQRQPRSCNNILSFLQSTAPIARYFCESCAWHHFTLWQQATIAIARRAHSVSACSRHMGVVLHAHPVRGESHMYHNAN